MRLIGKLYRAGKRWLAIPYLIFLFFPLTAHATLSNGSNAIDLLGQYDETSYTSPVPVYTKSGANNGPNKFGFQQDSFSVVDQTHWRLFVSDTSNGRVLVFALNSDGTLPDRVPDNILGQSNYYSKATAATQNGLNLPTGLAYDSTNDRLFVADELNNRVVVFSVSSITDGQNATNVLGQPNFTRSSSAAQQNAMFDPIGVAYDSTNNRLFVSELGNTRISVWSTSSIASNPNATNVLGQTTYTATTTGLTQKNLASSPYGVAYDDGAAKRLFIADQNNYRVLVYDITSGITDGQNAGNVLGQPNFTSNNFVKQQNSMESCTGVAFDSTNNRLFVSDYQGGRVEVYDVASITNGENMINVLGAADYTGGAAAGGQSAVSSPISVSYDTTNQRVYVGDRGYLRIEVYSVSSITNGQNAVDVVGQYDQTSFTAPVPQYTKSGVNDGPNKFGFNNARAVAVDTTNNRLFLADLTNNRVLVYAMNSNGTFVDRVPDNILGQSNYIAASTGLTQKNFSSPVGLAYDGTNNRLFVSESGNNRVLVFSVSSITDGQNATNVLGQPNFTKSTAATQQNGMNVPSGIAYDSTNQRLFVAQSTGNRVTVYSVSSITNGQNATNLLGQTSYTVATAATQQNGMNVPQGIAYDSTNNRLFVAQSTGNRVTVYDTSSITDGQNATNVLGQPNYLRATAASTQNGMNVPSGLAYDANNTRLFVGQSTGNRITMYNVSSITDGQNATNILGQPNYTASTAASTQNGMNSPVSLAFGTGSYRLFVGDSGANRLSVYDVAGTVSVSGTVYTDQGTTTMASGRTVAVSINGAAAAGTTTTAADGTYTISNLSITTGDVLTLYLDGATEKAVTVTIGTTANLTNIDLYQNRLIARCDNSSCSLTNANLSTAATNADTDITAIYTVDSSVLNVKSGKALFIPASHSFTPGNNVNIGSGITINGTLLPQGNTLTLSGTFLKASGGTFTASTSTVKLNGVNQTLSGSTTFYNLQKTVTSAATLTFAATTTQIISNALTLQGASSNLLSLRSSISGVQWKFNPQGTRTLTYLDVKDSNNTNATAIDATGNSVTDSGNLTNWTIPSVAATGGHAGHDATQDRIDQSAGGGNTMTTFTDTNSPSLSDIGIATQSVTTVSLKPVNTTILSFMTPEALSRKVKQVLAILSDRLKDNVKRFATQDDPVSAPGNAVQPQDTVVHLERALRRAEQRKETLLGAAPVGEKDGFLVSTVLADTVAYTDVPLSSWFAPYVATLVEEKIAHGYEDESGKPTGVFGVGNAVTRAESLKMIMLASGIALEDLPPPRNRSAQGTWASSYVAQAEAKNLSVFDPSTDVNASATRGEIVQMILELSGIPVAPNATPAFSDVPANHPYASAIATAAFYGLVTGDDASNTFRPDDPINRAEVAKIAALVKELMK